jgi:hypothetical protein
MNNGVSNFFPTALDNECTPRLSILPDAIHCLKQLP